MTADVPADVGAVLAQLFGGASDAFERGDAETGVAAVTSAASVARHKLPAGTLRERLLHGCERAEQAAVEGDLTVAAEYAASMARRLAERT